MKRNKRRTVRRIALGLAVAAVIPATAQARPMDVAGDQLRAAHSAAASDRMYPGELPSAVPAKATEPRVEIPYLSQGVGFSAADTGVVSRSVDDRPFSKATSVGAPSISTVDDGIAFDIGTGTVSGLILLLAGLGAGVAIRQSRRTKLSPA
jgi:hypothetical protein